MKTFADGLSAVKPMVCTAACLLLCAFHGAAWAQIPGVTFQQALAPEVEEYFPDGINGLPQQTAFGKVIARHGNTALINLEAYREGRVAVFTRNASGQWDRTGSLDPPEGQAVSGFGNSLAVDERAALIGSDQGVFVYRRGRHGFTLIQTLRNADGRRFAAGELWNGWVFIPSTESTERFVRVYFFTPRGLVPVQKLRSGEPDTDGFGTDIALANGTLLVAAPGDEDSRGAAYVFEQRHGLFWTKRQKLISTNAAPGDSFGQAVSIGDGVIAIGAPGVKIDIPPGAEPCGEGGFPYYFGNVYVFRRGPGQPWSERQALQGPYCVWGFGEAVAASGNWVVGAGPGIGLFDWTEPVLYRRDASGAYTAVGNLSGENPTTAVLNLAGHTLMVGYRTERNFEVGDIGFVEVLLLNQSPLQ
jgi:hypothetical protein